MSILDKILAVIAPHSCLQCGAEGSIFCRSCQYGLRFPAQICYRCGKASRNFMTCAGCGNVARVYYAAAYTGTSRQLVHVFKAAGGRSVAPVMARLMIPGLTAGHRLLLVPVPTATNHIRERGYDHIQLLANEVRRQSGLEMRRCLVRYGQTRQAGSNREQRLKQMSEVFSVMNQSAVEGRHIVLVDDVVTTGASLEAAAAVLLKAGARSVSAVVFARTPLG